MICKIFPRYLSKSTLAIIFICSLTCNKAYCLSDSLQKVLDKASSDTARVRILLLASSSSRQHDPELGSEYAAKALNLAQKTGNRLGIAQSYYTLGTNAYINKTLPQSHALFLKASVLFDSLHNLPGMAKAYSALGDVLGDEGDMKKSIDYYSNAKKVFLAAHDTLNSVYMDMSIASTLGMNNLVDSAISYTLSILPIAKKLKNDELISKIISNVGQGYSAQGKYEKALDYTFQALPYIEKTGDPTDIGDAYFNIGDIYSHKKDNKNAEKYALKGYAIYKEGKNIEGIAKASKLLAYVYTQEKDYAKATTWYANVISLNDTLVNVNMAKQEAEMQTKYETVKKEKAIAELNQKEKLETAELGRQRAIIYSGILILFLVLLGSLLLYTNFRKISKLNQLLEGQKQQLENQKQLLETQNDELGELNTIKNKLFSVISHDLRSPMSRIISLNTLLQRENVSETEQKKLNVDLKHTLSNTLQLLDNLLYWAASQMGGMKIYTEIINVKEMTEENLEFLKSEAELKKIQLETKIGDDIAATADMNMANFVLRNLLVNALKYTQSGGTIEIETEMDNDNKNVRIKVKDSGVGMTEETKNALFNEGVNKSTLGTAREGGFGIGLMLCKEFAEKNGGKLEVESTLGVGSIFSFTLPSAMA